MPKCYLCHDPYPAKREELGYKTCLDCGGTAANAEKQRKARCTAPSYSKGAYQYVATLKDALDLGR